MSAPVSLPAELVVLNYFGDIVFAFSGALVAARHRMDVLGIVLIGTVTGIGGGTLRDIILNHPVWWVGNPVELLLCAGTALAAYFVKRLPGGTRGLAQWADAIGLAAFAVVGAHVAQTDGASFVVVAFLGMLTATGGGVLRDLLTNTRPMILSGELYATAALLGAAAYTALSPLMANQTAAAFLAFALCLAVRGASMVFHIRFGIVGEPLLTMQRRPGGAESDA
ncbi:trimeric intracellular cation channel family protein [Reyranella sp.]|uniref:trimeric intracellular cation channel family protein n=1 Tax=Reyranella sp. TaxID=1929291 RepID=UPI003BACD033